MTTIKAIRLASLVTAINVLVASGFSIAAIIRPQYLVPAESVPTGASLLLAMYAAARTIPLALFALGAIYKQAAPALLILGAFAGVFAFPLLQASLGLRGTLLFTAGISVLGLLLTLTLPEPARRSLDEVSSGEQLPEVANGEQLPEVAALSQPSVGDPPSSWLVSLGSSVARRPVPPDRVA